MNKKFTLEERPYFYVIPNPEKTFSYFKDDTGESVFQTGVTPFYGNRGNYNASEIETDYKLFIDEKVYGKKELDKWWIEHYGSPPIIRSIPPKQEFQVGRHAEDEGFKENQGKRVQYNFRAKYKGPDKKEYKYGLDYVYFAKRLNENHLGITTNFYEEYLDEDVKEISSVKNKCEQKVKQ